jgi:HlyD family secretion protein
MNLRDPIATHVLAGTVAFVVLVFGLGTWAALAEFTGAVIAQGQLVVDTSSKKVQHPTGGVVAELLVRDGYPVKAGDVVLRLDDTQTRANLAIVSRGLDELIARRAREETELEGTDKVVFPRTLTSRPDDADVVRLMNGEQRLFETRRKTREGLKAQLTERISQSEDEIRGLLAQIDSKEKQVKLIKEELEGVRDLWSKKLIQFARVTALEREEARLEGERGQLIAASAQAKAKISETRIQILQIDQEMRTEVGKDLADIRSKMAELFERRVAAEDQLRRVELRAPQDGTVHQLDVHTVGGVVTPGQQIMLIVPAADRLIVEAKVQPQDIDQLRQGQSAVLRFSNFNTRTTREVFGQVSLVSADVTTDQRSGSNYYTVRIWVPPEEFAKLEQNKLIPGMPVDVFIQTTTRTVLSFFVRPFQDQIARAFRGK